jgi:hypothetical protein
MLNEGLSDLLCFTIIAEGQNSHNFGCNIIKLLLALLNYCLLKELFVVLSDKVEASSLHQEIFALNFALFTHRVESLLLVESKGVRVAGHHVTGLSKR